MRQTEEPPHLRGTPSPPLRWRPNPSWERGVYNGGLTKEQREDAIAALDACGVAPHSFWLGHGAGVGKTRILAAIALRFAEKRKGVLWCTPSSALCKEAADLFCLMGTPDTIKHVIIRSYASFSQNVPFYEPDFSLLLLDEAHLARNDTLCRDHVLRLQSENPHCAVVYSTGTPATCIGKISYMDRLGIWGPRTPFEDHRAFVSSLGNSGEGALELLPLSLKAQGRYRRRALVGRKGIRLLHLEPPSRIGETFDVCVRAWAGHNGVAKQLFFQRLSSCYKTLCLLPTFQRQPLRWLLSSSLLRRHGQERLARPLPEMFSFS